MRPSATFIFCSTNKVYGDLPNQLPLVELDTRLELPAGHRYYGGIDTTMSIDASTHSLFGVSKASADLLVQEYGRYFGMPTVCFRGGCLTGPNHAGTQLHGFLSYLMRCTMTGHALHGVRLRRQAGPRQHPLGRPRRRLRGLPRRTRAPPPSTTSAAAAPRNCSMLEAIALCEQIAGAQLDWTLSPEAPRSATTAGGSATSRAVRATTTRRGSCATASTRCSGRSTTPTRSAGSRETLGHRPPPRGRDRCRREWHPLRAPGQAARAPLDGARGVTSRTRSPLPAGPRGQPHGTGHTTDAVGAATTR